MDFIKVLLIGGTGNISSEITKELLNKNVEVTLVNRGNKNSFNNVKTIICDVKDKKDFYQKVKDLKFDCVIDMLCFNKEDAIFLVDTFKTRTKHLIVISSTASYQRPVEDLPIKSSNRLTKDEIFPYGFNKSEMEEYLENNFSNMNITIIRPSLTFGVGCKNVGVLRQNYNIINRILNNKPLISFGDGTNPFTFSFSPDVAKGIVLSILNENTFSKKYTLTSGYYHSFDDLYKMFGNVLNKEVTIYHIPTELLLHYDDMFAHIYYEKMHPGYYDITDFKSDVKEYEPKYDLKSGVQLLLDYFNVEKYIDKNLDNIEDDLVEKYLKFKEMLTCKNF